MTQPKRKRIPRRGRSVTEQRARDKGSKQTTRRRWGDVYISSADQEGIYDSSSRVNPPKKIMAQQAERICRERIASGNCEADRLDQLLTFDRSQFDPRISQKANPSVGPDDDIPDATGITLAGQAMGDDFSTFATDSWEQPPSWLTDADKSAKFREHLKRQRPATAFIDMQILRAFYLMQQTDEEIFAALSVPIRTVNTQHGRQQVTVFKDDVRFAVPIDSDINFRGMSPLEYERCRTKRKSSVEAIRARRERLVREGNRLFGSDAPNQPQTTKMAFCPVHSRGAYVNGVERAVPIKIVRILNNNYELECGCVRPQIFKSSHKSKRHKKIA